MVPIIIIYEYEQDSVTDDDATGFTEVVFYSTLIKQAHLGAKPGQFESLICKHQISQLSWLSL